MMEKEYIENCFHGECDPCPTTWENALRMTVWRRVRSLISVKNRGGRNPRTWSNACDKSGSPSDFTLAGFQKRGFSTNNIHFHLIEINWCSSRVVLFNITEQSWFVATHLEAARCVPFGNTSYGNGTDGMCMQISFWKCSSAISTGNSCKHR